jgi:hypothetical protein
MSTNAIISQSSLNVSDVSFGDVRMNKAGGKSVPIKFRGQNLQIRLEKATYPMGVNVRETDNGTTYTMSLTLRGCDPFAKERAGTEAGSTGGLYNFLLDLQNKILTTATDQSTKWFGKARSREVLTDIMKQFVSPSVEKINGEWVPTGKYPPSLKMKVPVYDGRVTMDVVDHVGKNLEVDIDNITQVFPKRVEASIVVSPSIYITGQGFGVTWRVSYAKVSPPQRTTAADVFRDEIEEERKAAPVATVTEEEEEHIEQEEVSVPIVEDSPSAPPAPAAPAPANRRRKVTAVA